MLKKELIPTRLVEEKEQKPVEILPLRKSRFTTLGVILALLRFAFSMQWGRLTRRLTPRESALRVRSFLEDMGGLWVKAGQILSLRRELLSPELVNQLTELQYHAFGFPAEVARKIVSDTLHAPIEDTYAIFEDRPFAAASISQVHRAFLKREQVWVAVKVQRPDIVEIFERDLKIIIWLLRRMAKIPALTYITWEGMIVELRQIVREEVDYRYESANLREMKKNLREHKIYVPKLYERYSGSRVLVMEMIDGVLMSDYLQVESANPARLAAWREENNIKPKKVGRKLLLSFYRQLFEDNLFHGDLHPGNIMLLRDSKFALIDLGTVGNLEPRFISNYRKQAEALGTREYSKAADLFLLLSDNLPLLDINAFRQDVIAAYRGWEARTKMRGLSYREKSITGGVAVEVSAIARKYKVNPSWQFLRVTRALGTLDTNLNSLLGNTNPVKLIEAYSRAASVRGLKRVVKNGFTTLSRTAADVTETATYAIDTLRRQAIQFEGTATTAAQIARMVFGWLRFGLVVGLIVLGYDLLHAHANKWVGELHPYLGPLASAAEAIPHYKLDLGIAVLVIVVLLIIWTSRARSISSQKTLRLPNGRLDS